MTRAGTRAMVALVTPAARFALLGVLALSIAGCGPGGAWIAGVIGLLLGFAACSQTHGGRDADTADDSGPATPDAGRDVGPGDGHRERCCEDGVITTCFCPGGYSCNYGLGLVECDDGSCGYEPFDCAPDAGVPSDAGGIWERCCVDGVITTCFCPGGDACNYGLFEDCGDGTCGFFEGCPDAG